MDVQSETVLGLFDIRPAFHAYCAQHNDDPDCICEGDLDGDGDQDSFDLATFSNLYQQGNFQADLNLDQQVNVGDIELFAHDYGRDDCGSVVPDCDDTNPCTEDYYEPVSAQCVHRDRQCNDHNACTVNDHCDPQSGECVFIPVNCDDQLLCTIDTCVDLSRQVVDEQSPLYECVNEQIDCDDQNACTNDFCDSISGECEHKTLLCNDELDYTVDQCDPVAGCFSVPKICDDENPCTIDSVDPASGQCISVPVDCNDGLFCTTDGCDYKTGECVHDPVTCEQDGDLCTEEVCTETSAGKCESLPISCDDNNMCTNDSCDPQSGCFYIMKDCDDGDFCTIDTCDPGTGQCLNDPDPDCQACCHIFTQGNCLNTAPDYCESMQGIPQGVNTSCETVNCK